MSGHFRWTSADVIRLFGSVGDHETGVFDLPCVRTGQTPT